MDRRAWLMGFVATAAVPAARSQPRPLIAVLNGAQAQGMRDLVEELQRGLAELGRVDGRDVEMQFRFAEGRPERLPGLLDELLKLRPAVLVAVGPRPVMVARDVGVALPVVAVHIDDPVIMGIAKTAARPGGRFTGISAAFDGILEKRLQLLADLTPGPQRRLGVLMNPNTVRPQGLRDALKSLEGTLGALVQVEARSADDLDAAFKALGHERVTGLVVLADATLYLLRHDIGARCRAMKLPSVWGGRGYLDAGGVASYQGDLRALYRRSTVLIDKVLRGTPPGEIPFEQGTKFELVIHRRNAAALGLTIPARMLVAADEVIE
jgi:putative tryptophan/tyrosine transport system substrate-binding protein